MSESFYKICSKENLILLKEQVKELPYFCIGFFASIENQTSVLTRRGYARDLNIFFNFLKDEISLFSNIKDIKEFTTTDLDKIDSDEILLFLNHVSLYEKNGKQLLNGENGKSRKLFAIRSFFKYLFNKNLIKANTASKVASPKKHDSEIIRLEPSEVAEMLNQAQSGENLTQRQKHYNNKTASRDVALLSLMLGTGIRVSECVGLNCEDLDFANNSFVITRKGGSRSTLYFSDEIKKTLDKYFIDRDKMVMDWEDENYKKTGIHKEFSEQGVWLSLQMTRLSTRAIENLVKKYAECVTTTKKITPHKLRSTYGTNLYRQTNDIYMVADVLGHRDVNTTKKHYAAQSDENRRKAATIIKLRDDNS